MRHIKMGSISAVLLVAVLATTMALCALPGCSNSKDSAADNGLRVIEMNIDGERPSVGSTLVPYEVTGRSADGNDVSISDYAGFGVSIVELAPGEYTFHFPASPLCPDGSYYAVPSDFELTVEEADGDDGGDGSDDDSPIEINFNVFKMSPYGVSDEMLDEALAYAKESPVNADKAQASYEKTLARRPVDTGWEKVD